MAYTALLLIVIGLRYWAPRNVRYRASEGLSEHLTEAWAPNKAYCPSQDEIEGWLELIKAESKLVENPEIFYAALIWAESSGNPTSKMDSGRNRGLMAVGIDAARDVCKRRGFKVDNIAIALYNPRFNIICGIDHYEHLLRKWDSEKWAMTIYNAGERKVMNWVSRGIGIKHTHWGRVQGKIKLIERR